MNKKFHVLLLLLLKRERREMDDGTFLSSFVGCLCVSLIRVATLVIAALVFMCKCVLVLCKSMLLPL